MDMNVSKYQLKDALRKQWTEQAVNLALAGNWDEAVQINLRILENYPDDIQARNRLGKAYYELGRHEEALAAYEESFKMQRYNNVARKKLAELYALLQREPAVPLGESMPSLELLEGEEEELDELESYIEEEEVEAGPDEEVQERD